MNSIFSRRIIIVLVVLTLFCLGLYAIYSKFKPVNKVEEINILPLTTVIGKSVEGREINAYTYGRGEKHLVFVGGVHGGYEWNSVLLAYNFMDYLLTNLAYLPNNLTVTVIPVLNPDGVYKVIGREGRFTLAQALASGSTTTAGRFNSNLVDLNRNFDCKWQPESTWKGNIVSAGSKAFSEPEAQALQGFVLKNKPTAVIFWHSQSNAVYASECQTGILPETLNLMNIYSLASGYPAVKSFTNYKITGDAEGWLASINIPAITVELKTHETVEWDNNLAGLKALFKYFSSNYQVK